MSRVTCDSPAHWRQLPGVASGARVAAQPVEVEVTLNGQDYVDALQHVRSFTYYPLDASPWGLSVHSLNPHGDASSG